MLLYYHPTTKRRTMAFNDILEKQSLHDIYLQYQLLQARFCGWIGYNNSQPRHYSSDMVATYDRRRLTPRTMICLEECDDPKVRHPNHGAWRTWDSRDAVSVDKLVKMTSRTWAAMKMVLTMGHCYGRKVDRSSFPHVFSLNGATRPSAIEHRDRSSRPDFYLRSHRQYCLATGAITPKNYACLKKKKTA